MYIHSSCMCIDHDSLVYIPSLAHTALHITDDICGLYCRNYAIADYLQSQGYGETLDSFRRELDTVSLSTSPLWYVCAHELEYSDG